MMSSNAPEYQTASKLGNAMYYWRTGTPMARLDVERNAQLHARRRVVQCSPIPILSPMCRVGV